MSADRCHVAAGTLRPCAAVAKVIAAGGDVATCFRWRREGEASRLRCLACGGDVAGDRVATISPTES